MLYIIIPVFNRWLLTQACLSSLKEQTCKQFQVVVVDHGSTDGTSIFIKNEFPEVIILKGKDSMWWTAATNLGVRYALSNNAVYILTLNNDLIVDRDYISIMLDVANSHPNSIIGSISVDIANAEHIAYAGTKWIEWLAKYSSPVFIDVPYSQFKITHDLIESDLLPGRGTLIKSSIFNSIGLYNEEEFPHYMADEEFSLRARRAGYSLLVNVKGVVLSHIIDTGLNNLHTGKKGIRYLRDTFTSIRSPNKIVTRWNWAKRSKVPVIYFTLDFGRVFVSQLIKILKSQS